MAGNIGVVVIGVIAAAVLGAIVFVGMLRRRSHPLGPIDPVEAELDDSGDSVMRALSLVQHRYAALSRSYDMAQDKIRELEVERDHWRRQAMEHKAP